MPYNLPTFNLTCNINTVAAAFPGTFRLASPCNLALGRRVAQSGLIGFADTTYGAMTLLLPALTDIRDCNAGPPPYGDCVEVPAGSGRFYAVTYVDDIGKGFANEHRFAWLLKAVPSNGGEFVGMSWPVPYP